MKIRSRLFRSLFFTILWLSVPGEAQTLTQKEIKKFKGEYIGSVTGIAGNASAGTVPVTFETRVTFTGKSREFLAPQISNLHVPLAHRIVYRKPTGTSQRIEVTGYYTGTAINPTTGLPEPVSGIRKMTITDRGKGKKARFAMQFSDTLRGGAYSAQDIKGTLRKKK
jgi:hypothetical protein